MAKSDVLVRMKADINNYDANIAKAKRTLDNFKQENLSLGGVMNQMAKSFTAYAAGLASISALAGKLSSVVSESVELAKSGEGIRLAFEKLNKPGILDNLREATHGTVTDLELMKAAVKFNDFKLPIEELGTMLAFAQQKAKDTGQSVDYMVDSIVTGLGRKSLMILDNLGLSAAEIKEKMKESGDMTKAVGQIIREQMEKAGDYVETAADRAARATAENKNRLEELGREIMPVAETFDTAWKEIELGGLKIINKVLVPMANSLRILQQLWRTGKPEWSIKPKPGVKNLADDPNVDDNGNYIKKNWNTGNMITYSSVASIGDIVVSGNTPAKKPKGGGGKTNSFDISKIAFKPVSDEMMKYNPDTKWMSVWATMSDEAKRKTLGFAEAAEDLGGSLAQLGEDQVIAEVNQQVDDMNRKLAQEQMAFNMAAQAASAFGQALAGIEDPAAKAAGTVMQAVASIALGFATASANANTAGTGWGWLAWLAAGASAMATTIGMIHSLTGYAEGGEVKGNSYSGDQIPIMANAGEIVLTRAQAGAVAAGLQSARSNNLTARVTGEQIVLAANNYLKRTGQGELVTWG